MAGSERAAPAQEQNDRFDELARRLDAKAGDWTPTPHSTPMKAPYYPPPDYEAPRCARPGCRNKVKWNSDTGTFFTYCSPNCQTAPPCLPEAAGFESTPMKVAVTTEGGFAREYLVPRNKNELPAAPDADE